MSVLVFEVRSSMAHFRRPDTLGTHVSYPFITRTALHGLIASVLGLDMLPKSPRCGIRLLAPVRTVSQEMSMLGKGWSGSGSDFNRPTSIEIVVKPHYRIYYRGPMQDDLERRIREGRSHYHTYLGSAYCLAFPSFYRSYSEADVSILNLSGTDEITCVSVVPSEGIARLRPKQNDEYARVGGVLYEHIGGRSFRGSLNLIYEVQGRPVTFTPAATDDTSKSPKWEFLNLLEEGTVCLW